VRAAFITHIAITSGRIGRAALARHSDFKTTQGYIEVADEVMRDAVKAATGPMFGIVKGGKR
jgi:hypothetical protein